MRRFRWKLQRVLDVTNQRELAARAKLAELSRRIAWVRGEIVSRRASLRMAADELAAEDFSTRRARLELFLRFAAVAEGELQRLCSELRSFESDRDVARRRLIEVRSRRRRLERIGEDARREHIRGELRLEQREMDELWNISYARRLNAHRVVKT